MTYIPASEASVLAAIAENPGRLSTGALLETLTGEAKEIARVLVDPKAEVSADVRTTAEALQRWAASNKNQKSPRRIGAIKPTQESFQRV
jgi:hypothetical protein